jgi:hypothetical protein
MARRKVQRVIYRFEVEVEGRTYKCERVVDGTRVLTQSIRVEGIGTESDSASYGSRGHPVASMPGIAELIAERIIKTRLEREQRAST